MINKLLYSSLLSLFFITNLHATTYTFLPNDLIFRTLVQTYNGVPGVTLSNNGSLELRITGGSMQINADTNTSSVNFNFIIQNAFQSFFEATPQTIIPAGTTGTITGQLNSSGLRDVAFDASALSFASFGNYNLLVDFNDNNLASWEYAGRSGISCTMRNCSVNGTNVLPFFNSLEFQNTYGSGESVGFGLYNTGNNIYRIGTDYYTSNTSGLVTDNTWFAGNLRLIGASQSAVPEPMTVALLASGILPGIVKKRRKTSRANLV